MARKTPRPCCHPNPPLFYGKAGNANNGKGGSEGNDYVVIGDTKWPSQGNTGCKIACQTYGTYEDAGIGLMVPVLYAMTSIGPEEETYDSETIIEEKEDTLCGKPLSGVITTLLVGVTGLAALRMRKRRQEGQA